MDSHIKKVKEWADKWKDRGDIIKAWHDYIISEEAQSRKNSTLQKTHREENRIRLLTTGCNMAIENFSRFIEKICATLTNKIDAMMNDTEHLLQMIDNINANECPNDTILVSFDIVNMFPNIDNIK